MLGTEVNLKEAKKIYIVLLWRNSRCLIYTQRIIKLPRLLVQQKTGKKDSMGCLIALSLNLSRLQDWGTKHMRLFVALQVLGSCRDSLGLSRKGSSIST